jgi:hypothetical protein
MRTWTVIRTAREVVLMRTDREGRVQRLGPWSVAQWVASAMLMPRRPFSVGGDYFMSESLAAAILTDYGGLLPTLRYRSRLARVLSETWLSPGESRVFTEQEVMALCQPEAVTA